MNYSKAEYNIYLTLIFEYFINKVLFYCMHFKLDETEIRGLSGMDSIIFHFTP